VFCSFNHASGERCGRAALSELGDGHLLGFSLCHHGSFGGFATFSEGRSSFLAFFALFRDCYASPGTDRCSCKSGTPMCPLFEPSCAAFQLGIVGLLPGFRQLSPAGRLGFSGADWFRYV